MWKYLSTDEFVKWFQVGRPTTWKQYAFIRRRSQKWSSFNKIRNFVELFDILLTILDALAYLKTLLDIK